MNLLDVLRLLLNRPPDPPLDGDERLREAERRIMALDATIGAQQARRTRDRFAREQEARRATH